jgi:TolB-like protein
MKKIFFLTVVAFTVLTTNIFSQVRIAVIPFNNMDGNVQYNEWCYNLQDSLVKELLSLDPNSKYFHIIPIDSVELVLAEINIDPNNPQYESDLWAAIQKLNVRDVITGNFKIQAKRFLINAYIYDVATKLPKPEYQVRDIFKKEDKVYDAVPIIARNLVKAYIPTEQ